MRKIKFLIRKYNIEFAAIACILVCLLYYKIQTYYPSYYSENDCCGYKNPSLLEKCKQEYQLRVYGTKTTYYKDDTITINFKKGTIISSKYSN